ncbi:hypothetical protein Scep_014537 [Stephania cephalantha]|uniref:Uncharacterized protein n=1 Tax=Stephania cephalantha TaxID=152367 RepID=A0AAP0J1D9_9MAGN
MIYAFRLFREQSIALSSFVEVTPYCPLSLCLVMDRSVRQRAGGRFSTSFTVSLPLLIHRSFSPASLLLTDVLVDHAIARLLPPQPRHLLLCRSCWPSAPLYHPPPRLLAWADSSLAGAAVREPSRADLLAGSLLHREPPLVSWSSATCTVHACWHHVYLDSVSGSAVEYEGMAPDDQVRSQEPKNLQIGVGAVAAL